jgi:Na+-driven multidrug efflux pump
VKMLLPNRNSFKNLTSTIRDELKVGFPMGLQNSVISIGMMVLQYFVNQFGSYAVAAYTIGNRVQLLIQNPMNSMSTVIATFAGQNEGAGRYDRIKKGVNFCLLICIFNCNRCGFNDFCSADNRNLHKRKLTADY